LAEHVPEDQLIMGPNFVNHIFGRSLTAELAKPDIVGFKPVHPQMWELATLYECKNSVKLHENSKLEGYKFLLNKLRRNPLYLSSVMQDYDGEHLQMPKLISIPDNQELSVVFLSPIIKKGSFAPDKRFQVSYQRITPQ
jgi:hypothetical protein